jgi:ribulose-bisphosphate carboxylase large chain
MSPELVVTYRVRADRASIEARADALLLEQTVELPRRALHDAAAAARVVGRIASIEQVADDDHRVVAAQPLAATGEEPAQLVNVLFGNSSLQPDVVLEDVSLPAPLVNALGGPRFGIDGLRAVVGAHGRALTCTALKPMGLAVEQLASLASTFARAGVDIVKDDHGLGDQAFARYEERVRACQQAVDDVAGATGKRALYVPNLVGAPRALRRQADIARAVGARAVMVSPMLVGLPAFHELVAEDLGVPVIAHPSFGGAQRIEPVALLARLFTALGADAVIFPSYGGRFSYDRDTCGRLARTMRQPSPPMRPAMPVPAGGVTIERVPELLAFYGPDTALLVGASVLVEPERIESRSRSLVEAVRAGEATS